MVNRQKKYSTHILENRQKSRNVVRNLSKSAKTRTSHVRVVGEGGRVVDSCWVEAARLEGAVVGRRHVLSRLDKRLLELRQDVLSVGELSESLKVLNC